MRRLQLLSFLSFTDTQRCFIQKDNGGFLLHFPRVATWNFFCFRTRRPSLIDCNYYLPHSHHCLHLYHFFLNRLVLDCLGPLLLSCVASKVLQVMESTVIQASVSEISCTGQLANSFSWSL